MAELIEHLGKKLIHKSLQIMTEDNQEIATIKDNVQTYFTYGSRR